MPLKQELYTRLWKSTFFLLCVQIIEQNHTSISIFPTIINGSSYTFIPTNAQSASSISAKSTRDKYSTGHLFMNWHLQKQKYLPSMMAIC